MVFHVFAAQCEQLLDQMWQGDDRRSRIKGEAVLLMHISPTTWGIKLFDHLHGIALDAQPYRGRQATEAGPNDDRSRGAPLPAHRTLD